MTIRNRDKYNLANENIKNGKWIVYPNLGIVTGRKGKVLGSIHPGNGYIRLSLTSRCGVLAHVVIWEFVNGVTPDDMEINHINGDKGDNRIQNLELLSPQNNTQHAHDIGIAFRWNSLDHPARKLDFEKARNIRQLYEEGKAQKEIAGIFNVDRRTINNVILNKVWRV